MSKYDIPDDLWKKVEPWLEMPRRDPRGARDKISNQRVLNAVLYRMRTGKPWRELPQRYGTWQTVYRRAHQWETLDVWRKVLKELTRYAGTLTAAASVAGAKVRVVKGVPAKKPAASKKRETAQVKKAAPKKPESAQAKKAAPKKRESAQVKKAAPKKPESAQAKKAAPKKRETAPAKKVVPKKRESAPAKKAAKPAGPGRRLKNKK